MSVVVPVPMLALSLLFDGPAAIGAGLVASVTTSAGLVAWLSLVYTVLIGTVVGSGLWTWLMARHPAGAVAPFSMLVPVVGIGASALVLHERPNVLELVGAAVVIGGVLIGSLRLQRRRQVRARRGRNSDLANAPS